MPSAAQHSNLVSFNTERTGVEELSGNTGCHQSSFTNLWQRSEARLGYVTPSGGKTTLAFILKPAILWLIQTYYILYDCKEGETPPLKTYTKIWLQHKKRNVLRTQSLLITRIRLGITMNYPFHWAHWVNELKYLFTMQLNKANDRIQKVYYLDTLLYKCIWAISVKILKYMFCFTQQITQRG